MLKRVNTIIQQTIRQNIGMGIALLITGYTGASFNLIFPLMFKWVIDELIPRQRMDQLILVSFVLLGGLCISSVCNYLAQVLHATILQNISVNIGECILSHQLRIPYLKAKALPSGHVMSLLMSDIPEYVELLSRIYYPFIINFTKMIVIILIIFWINVFLAFVITIFIPIYLFQNTRSSLKIEVTSRSLRKNIESLATSIQENNSGLMEIKSYNLMEYWENRFSQLMDHIKQNRLKILKESMKNNELTTFLSGFLPVLIIILGSYLSFSKQVSLGTLIAFITYISVLFDPLRALLSIRINFHAGKASKSRMDDFLSIPCEPESAEMLLDNWQNGIDIKISNLSYQYPNSKEPTFQNLNLEIKRNSKVAIIGGNGSGKSTLLQIISGLIDDYEGNLYINNIDYKLFSPRTLRGMFGIIPQDFFLFNTSLIENIKMGRMDASDDSVNKAIQLTYSFDIVQRTPPQKGGLLGDHDETKLSRGEMQRVALARAVLKNAPVIILDEPTSALDTTSKYLIMDNILSLENKTIIIVTHDPVLLKGMDIIIKISNGNGIVMSNYDFGQGVING